MASYTWTGAAGDNDFGNALNWSPPGGPPQSGDMAVISVSAATNITCDGSSVGGLSTNANTTLLVDNNQAFTFSGLSNGTFSNGGTLLLNSGGNGTDLNVNEATLTLTGGGQIALSNNGNNFIEAGTAGDALNNVNNLIAGAGTVGGNDLAIVNGAGGVIDANQTGGLVINTGTSTTTNSGTLEATGSGGLYLESAVNNGTSGMIEANGATVAISGASITGGTLSSTGTGSVVDNGTATLTNLTNAGTLVVQNNDALDVSGTLTNKSLLQLQSGGNGTDLIAISSAFTLTGGGTLSLTDNGNNFIGAAAATDKFVNAEKIAGSGSFGSMTLLNSATGTISATGANALIIAGSVAATNNGLLQATGTGGLVLQDAITQATTAKILANGGNVDLDGGSISGGTLASAAGAAIVEDNFGTIGNLTNAGTLQVANNTTLYAIGTITNTGVVALESGGNGTDFTVDSTTVSLTGGGTITLSDNANNAVNDAVAGETLVNVNNTIIGAGVIGGGTLSLTNSASGSIVALGNNALYLATSGAVITNAGLLEAQGAGGLWIETAVTNTGTGDIVAKAADVVVDGGTITGGTLVCSAGGVFVDNNVATLVNLTNSGTFQLANNDTLYALGTVANTGTIQLNSVGNGTEFAVGPTSGAVGTFTLTGGGQVAMTDNANNYITAGQAGDTLVNLNNTIAGSGYFANGLVFVNDAIVDASSTNNGISFNGGSTVTNNGLIEDSVSGNGGIAINTTISNASGTILASGGNVYLQSGDIVGGILNTANGGEIQETSIGTLDGTAGLTNLGIVAVNNDQALELLGSITNSGTIELNSDGNNTDLGIDSTVVTLTGNGAIVLSSNVNNEIYATTSGNTLLNLNNTITGAGFFANGLVLVNDATIDANQASSLSLNGGLAVTNNGVLESTASGGLLINTTIANASGTIAANGGNVTLQSADIEGGTLTAASGYNFAETSIGTLDGSAHAVTLQGTFGVNNDQALELVGQIANQGVLQVNSGGNNTDLGVDGATVTLTGGGTIALTDNVNNEIYAVSGGDTLINVNNTIEGAGFFANGLVLLNEATIDASGTNSALSLNGGLLVTNQGLIESTGSGGLLINAVVNNAGGTIAAKGGAVTLQSGEIEGGTLTASSGGIFYETSVGTLDGAPSAVTLQGTFVVDNDQQLDLFGVLHNDGVLEIDSGGNGTDLYLGTGTVTVSGTGTILLSDNANNTIFGGSGSVLDVTGGTIEGAGNIGDGGVALISGGLIEATGSNTLYIDTGTTGTNTASGRWVGEGSGGLQVVNGTYTNAGLIEALNGSAVTFASSASLTNDAGGTLTGGTYEAASTTGSAAVSITGSAVTTLAGSIILSGTLSSISFGGSTIDSSLQEIGTSGLLEVAGSRVFTAANALLDNGLVEVSSASVTVSQGLSISSTGTLLGHGIVKAAVSDAGLIDASGGKLQILGAVTGTGQLQAAAGAILDLKTAGTLSEAASGAGTLELDATTAIAGQTDAVAVTLLTAPGTLSGYGAVTGAVIDDGLLRANGGTLAVGGSITGTGHLSALAGSTLKLSAGSSDFTYAVAGAGTLELAGAYTLAAAPTTAALVVDAGASVTATGTLIPTITDNGLITAGSGTLVLSEALHAGSGTLQAASGAVLDMAGGAFDGSFDGPGTINVQSTLTVATGVSLGNGVLVTDSSNIGESAGATLGIAAGATLALSSVGASGTLLVGLASGTLTNAGTLAAAGAGAVNENNALVNTGLISSTAHTLAFGGTFSNNGTVDDASGLTSIKSNVTGTGTLEIGAAGTLSVLNGAVSAQSTDFFSTSGGLLDLTNATHFMSSIAGFGGSDVIDLLGAQETNFSYANGVLKVLNGTTAVASLHFSGSYVQTDFQVMNTNSTTVGITFV